MKKIIVLFFAVLLLASCSHPSVELMDFLGDENDFVIKYDGYVFKLYQDADVKDYVIVYPDVNSPQSDALLERIKEIEDKYDIVIERTNKGSEDTIEFYIRAIGSNATDVDLLFRDNGKSTWFWADAGVCIPFTDFPDIIDLSDFDKYGSPGVLEAAMINGKPITVQPGYWPGYQSFECFYMVYNKDMSAMLGVTDLHEYYENETWTWDSMLEYFDSAMIGIERDEQLLFTGHSGYLLNTMLYSNGFDFVEIVEGKPVFNLYADSCLNTLEFYKELDSRYGKRVDIGTTRWDIDKFVEENSLTAMAIAQDVITGQLAYNIDFNYGLMPFPCGPDGTYGEWAQSVTRASGFNIPVIAKEPELAARVVSDFCDPFDEFGGDKQGLIDYYSTAILPSELDGEIYFAVEGGTRYDYDDIGIIALFQGIALDIRTKSPMEVLQARYNTIYDKYKEYIEPNLTGYILEHMNID